MTHTEFMLFCSLPRELQDKVWSFALAAATPRVHGLDVYPRSGSVILSPTSSLAESTRPAREIASVCRRAKNAMLRELPHSVTLRTGAVADMDGKPEISFRINGRRDVLLLNGLDARVMDFFNSAVHGAKTGKYIDRQPLSLLEQEQQSTQVDQEDDGGKASTATGIHLLGLPQEIALIAISVPDDFYYRAFNVWPFGWSDSATNVLRKFILSFPNLRKFFLTARFPVLYSGVAQARALIRDLADPEEWSSGGLNPLPHPQDKSTVYLEWFRGTAIGGVPPWLLSKPKREARGGGEESKEREDGGDGGDEGDEDDCPAEDEEGRDWFLAARPYHNWGAGIPALSRAMEANLWRQARLTKVLGGSDDDLGMGSDEVERLEKIDVSMLLWVDW